MEDARGAIVSHLEALREFGQDTPTEANILIATVALPAA